MMKTALFACSDPTSRLRPRPRRKCAEFAELLRHVGRFDPPLPVPVWSPPCAMKPLDHPMERLAS